MRANTTGAENSGIDIWCPTPWPPVFSAGPQVHYRFNGGEGGDVGDDLAACSDYWVKLSDFTGRWHHWVFVKNGLNDTMAIYHDGVLACTESTGQSAVGEIETGFINIGGFNQYTNPSYAGGLDDMRFYNYALSAQEVAYLTTSGTGSVWLPLVSPADLYTSDPNVIDFRDFSVLGADWGQEVLWPVE
jgi:hypothetical protein